MAYTFASPCRSICHDLTNFLFDNEQSNTTTEQGSEYDADTEAAGVEDNRSIASPAQVITLPVIAWRTVNTTPLGATRVAEVHVFAQADIIDRGHWHALRTSQIEPRQSTHPQSGGWSHVSISPQSTLQIKIADTRPSEFEDTQFGIIRGSEGPVFNGAQTHTSQATVVRPHKAPSRYLKMFNNLALRPKRIGVDMPQLKANFRKYKKEYTSAATIKQINSIRYRIAHVGTGTKDENDFELAAIESEWGSLWDRRRWLKQEMLRIKSLYTLARRRRQERIQYDLRASYDIAFIKSLE